MLEKHDLDLMLELQLQGRHVEARVLSDKLESLGPENIKDINGRTTEDIWLRHSFNRGWFLLQEGKYQEGCRRLENGRFLGVYGNPPPQTKAVLFNPEEHDITGKTVLLVSEGGLGDEIIHSRFAKSYKKLGAGKVYISCSLELKSLFERIDGVDLVLTRSEVIEHDIDYWIPGFSAGWVAGHTFEDLPSDPYLSAREETIDMWGKFLNVGEESSKPKVGIRWAGNPKFEHQQFRRFPPAFITNISKYDIDVYSFQRDHNTIDLPENIVDLQHQLISWEDTAAAIQNLDLVITSCTSVAHLSSAMGKETWVIVPALPYHTWTWKSPDSTTTPYYQNTRIFRQREYGKWNDVFQQMYAALEERFNLSHIDMPNEDRAPSHLNLGCDLHKIPRAINVDKNPKVNPDCLFDLEQTPWPWKDNEFSQITACNILQYLGDTPDDFINIIKEMYRVSENGAVWLITVPHHRSEKCLADIYAKRTITPLLLEAFDQRLLMDEKIVRNNTSDLLGYMHGVDISIAGIQFKYNPRWAAGISNGEINQEDLSNALIHNNDVASDMLITIQVHKAPRYKSEEFEVALEQEMARFEKFVSTKVD